MLAILAQQRLTEVQNQKAKDKETTLAKTKSRHDCK